MNIDGFDFSSTVTNEINEILSIYFPGEDPVGNFRGWWSKRIGTKNPPKGLITSMGYGGITYERPYNLTTIEGENGFFYFTPKKVDENDRESSTHLKNINSCTNQVPIYAYLRLNKELARKYGIAQRVASNFNFKLHPISDHRLCKYNHVYKVDVARRNIHEADSIGAIEFDAEISSSYLEQRILRARNIEAKKIAHKHSILLNELIIILRHKHGCINIFPERSLCLDHDDDSGEYIGQADVVLKHENQICQIFEVKTESTMSENIRAALGQLISYGRISQGKSSLNLCVVSDAKRDAEGECFLKYLNSIFISRLKISYEVIKI